MIAATSSPVTRFMMKNLPVDGSRCRASFRQRDPGIERGLEQRVLREAGARDRDLGVVAEQAADGEHDRRVVLALHGDEEAVTEGRGSEKDPWKARRTPSTSNGSQGVSRNLHGTWAFASFHCAKAVSSTMPVPDSPAFRQPSLGRASDAGTVSYGFGFTPFGVQPRSTSSSSVWRCSDAGSRSSARATARSGVGRSTRRSAPEPSVHRTVALRATPSGSPGRVFAMDRCPSPAMRCGRIRFRNPQVPAR